jgi:molybdopterin/thiamine biosynthesis adenylyltransferase
VDSVSNDSLPLELVFTAQQWLTLRTHLIRENQQESSSLDEQLAFMLASSNVSNSRRRLLVRELLLAGLEDLTRQSPVGIAPCSEFVLRAMNRCLGEGWHLIEIHSHPFDASNSTTFSPIDWGNDQEKMPAWARIIPDMMHVTMVMGQQSFDAHFYDRGTQTICPVERITLVGLAPGEHPSLPILHYLIPTSITHQSSATGSNDGRYDRQERLFGRESQQRLRSLCVAVVGLGGLGSFVALELAYLGVGHLILIDPDRVEITNLNRLLAATPTDIGRGKVTVYKDLIGQIDPTIQVDAFEQSIIDKQAREHVKDADVLMGCVDSHGARLILNQIAMRYLIPLIDGGSGARQWREQGPFVMGGQVQVVVPGSGCLECSGFIDPQRAAFDLAPPEQQEAERRHGYGTRETAPAVISLNGVIASAQVMEFMFLATGRHSGPPPTSMYDAFQRTLQPIMRQPSEHCVTCGEDGVIGLGDLAPLPFDIQPDPPREQIIPENTNLVQNEDSSQAVADAIVSQLSGTEDAPTSDLPKSKKTLYHKIADFIKRILFSDM